MATPAPRRSGIPGLRLGTYTGRDGKQHTSEQWVLWIKRKGVKRRRIALGTDRAEAEREARSILADLDSQARAQAAGRRGDRQGIALVARERDLEKHLDEFLAAVESRQGGRSATHLADLEREVIRYLDHSRAQNLDDLTRESAQAWLADLAAHGCARDPNAKGGVKVGPASQRTLQRHRGAICSWSRWLARECRLEADPFAALDGYAPSMDRRRERGAFSREEVDALLLSRELPLYRLACWHIASCTGLRRSEMGRLLRTHLDLDAGICRPPARIAKGKRLAALPLTPEAVAVLRRYWAALDHGKRTRPRWRAPIDLARALPEGIPDPERLYADLRTAGVACPESRGGLVRDVHSLRVTAITTLAESGLPLAAVQAMARHRDPRTTMASYYDLPEATRMAAVEALRPKKRKARRRA